MPALESIQDLVAEKQCSLGTFAIIYFFNNSYFAFLFLGAMHYKRRVPFQIKHFWITQILPCIISTALLYFCFTELC